MKLKKLTVHQFCSIQHAEVDFSRQGTVLVLGQMLDGCGASNNGAGKSALLVESLSWLFFNQLVRASSRFISRVKRNYRGKDVVDETYVEAHFERFGREYRVRRSLENGYTIQVDSGELTPFTKDAGAAKVRGIIGIEYSLWSLIAVMGQGFPAKLSSFSDGERSSLVEGFIGAVEYESAETLASKDVAAATSSLNALRAQRVATATARGQTDATLTTLRKQLDALRSQASHNYQQKQQTLADVKAKIVEIDAALASLANTSPEPLLSQWRQSEADTRVYLTQMQGHRAKLQDTIQGAESSLSGLDGAGVCPTCSQPTPAQLVEKLRSQFQTIVSQGRDELVSLEAAIQQAQANLTKAQQNIPALTHQCTQHNARVAQLDRDRVSHWTTQQAIQLDLQNPDTQVAMLEEQVRGAEERLRFEVSELDRIDQQIAQLQVLLPLCSWWVEGFSIRGARNLRIANALDPVNVKLQEYTQVLFDGKYQLSLTPEKVLKSGSKPAVSLRVTSPAGCYEMSSGAQCRKFDLALHLALRSLARDTSMGWASNFLIVDEVLDYLDHEGALRVLSVLRGEPDLETIVVISHDVALQGMADRTLTVKYRDETSYL